MPQQEQDLSKSAAEQTAVPAGIKDQMKASEIMAEKLPGLIDPNLPPDQQPLNDNSNPNPAAQPPQRVLPAVALAGIRSLIREWVIAVPAGASPVRCSTPARRLAIEQVERGDVVGAEPGKEAEVRAQAAWWNATREVRKVSVLAYRILCVQLKTTP